MNERRKRVLFFAEPATLAHVVRPVVLACALDPARYEVAVATGPDFRTFVEQAGLSVQEVWAIGTRAYLGAVAAGRPVFPYPVLERYLQEDLRCIEDFEPDIVIGDFRLSLAASARLARVPYLAISNAYWSPFAPVRFEVPAHITTRLLGPRVMNAIFQTIRPLIFAHHSLPMNRLLRRHGLPEVGYDLRRVFTEADATLFADVPQMVPSKDCGEPGRYEYLGPISWSPDAAMPEELRAPSESKPLVYANLGSSGDPRLLELIVEAALPLGCQVAITTGYSRLAVKWPKDVVAAPLLPGDRVARRAALVVCNGGSPSTHQALREGVPVLGIPANLDQLMNMQFVVASGAGLSLRSDRASRDRIGSAIATLLTDPSLRESASRVASWFGRYSPAKRFNDILGARGFG